MKTFMELSKERRDEAYYGISGTLGSRQAEVLKVIVKHPLGISNADIARKMGMGVNQVTGRTFELRKANAVESFGKATDPVTGMTVTLWKVADTFVDFLRKVKI